jgi:glycosyltransferase involved in cell wall biosynthesis
VRCSISLSLSWLKKQRSLNLHRFRETNMDRQSQPIRLAILSHRFQRNDGQGRVNFEVASAALHSGYQVTIVATTCSEELSGHPRCRFVKTGNDGLPTELLRNLAYANGSARWLRAHRHEFDIVKANGFVTWEPCDIVAAHFVHAAWGRSPWYPFKNLRPYSLYQRLYTALNTRWERVAFTSAKRVIAVARPLVHELVDIGVRADNVDVVWNGVDTSQFHPGGSHRQFFGLSPEATVALFVGDIRTPRKNLDTVLRAMRQAPGIFLVVAGAVDRSPYPALARDLDVAQRVKFLGQVKTIDLLMRSVDMFVFPSRYEAHPLVLLEAMASGLPSIVSGTFGADEFIGGGGFILDHPDDDQALAAYMRTLAADPALRSSMGAAGRRRALEMHWSTTANHYLRIFEEVIEQKHAGPVGAIA